MNNMILAAGTLGTILATVTVFLVITILLVVLLLVVKQKFRITSYNVCYTKLLRH